MSTNPSKPDTIKPALPEPTAYLLTEKPSGEPDLCFPDELPDLRGIPHKREPLFTAEQMRAEYQRGLVDAGWFAEQLSAQIAALTAENERLQIVHQQHAAEIGAELDALRAQVGALLKAGIEAAAALAQRKPLRALSHLEEASHIGHRQFARAYEQADEDTCLMAIALRDAIDAAIKGQTPDSAPSGAGG